MSTIAISTLVFICVVSYVGSFLSGARERNGLSVDRALLLPLLFGVDGFLIDLAFLTHHSISLAESLFLFTATVIAVSVGGLICGRVYRKSTHPREFLP